MRNEKNPRPGEDRGNPGTGFTTNYTSKYGGSHTTSPTGDRFEAGGLSPLGIAALGYTEWGLEVLPLDGKRPRIHGGVNAATTDTEQVAEWWSKWPYANIGIRVPEGCLVVDVDPRNGGLADYRRMFPHGSCPHTGRTFTGSGGLHLYFTLPYDGETRGKYGTGIDLQGRGKFLVAPPSIHPTTGRAYAWWPFVPPEKWAPLPSWCYLDVYKPPRVAPREPLEIRRYKAQHAKNPGAGLIRAVAEAQQGERNSLLYWAARCAHEDGLQIDAELTNAALQVGLSETETERTIASAKRAGAAA
ncbi:bifunctional DNA primase/polymerase domain protein [Corynebacterium glucuronolyticum ATCC 51867]|nr:bifunctional DNA primase/polymerase [Corynebacterium glucuronolyticum]EEI27915.1 bifunctional DNA primase/polymerase domain protein [Corynebacterium glucuronolyticum ATCC 51867]